jgi:hypothetical protein
LSGTGETHVEKVGIKSKKTKLGIYTPSDPIKTTHHLDATNISETSSEQRKHSENFSEQRKHPASSEQIREPGVTAVLAEMTSARSDRRSSKKASVKKTIRVLLDSGSDGDLLFHKKGTAKQFSYLTRQVPKTWHTSNGDFQTKWKGDLQLKFFQYSNSKRVLVQPDIVEYDGVSLEKPLFDLILGTKKNG